MLAELHISSGLFPERLSSVLLTAVSFVAFANFEACWLRLRRFIQTSRAGILVNW